MAQGPSFSKTSPADEDPHFAWNITTLSGPTSPGRQKQKPHPKMRPSMNSVSLIIRCYAGLPRRLCLPSWLFHYRLGIDVGRLRLAMLFWIEVLAALAGSLVFFDRDAVSISEGVLPDTCNLPRNLDVRLVRLDAETVACDLVDHSRLR